MIAIKYKLDRKGKRRAYYFSRPLLRWIRMPLDEADLLLTMQGAYEVAADSILA